MWAKAKRKVDETHRAVKAIGAPIPLLVSSVASPVESASTLGGFLVDFVVFGPSVAGTEGGAANRGTCSVGDTKSVVMQAGKGSVVIRNLAITSPLRDICKEKD